MDAPAIVNIISTVGFPIACCCYLFHSNDKLRETIAENTEAINSLKTMIMLHNNEVQRDC